ncbi:MAG: hypothetical protein WD672_06765 [Woeseia sp.]
MAQEKYTFGVSTTGETFAIPTTGPKVVSLLRGSKTSLRNQLAKEYYARHGKVPPQQSLADALLVIGGMAQESDEQELVLRTYRSGGDMWLDLGDPSGQAIRVTENGWCVEEQAPVLFKRTVLNGPLPMPERGGDLAELWKFMNVTDADKPLLTAWLVAALMHDIPHPVLALFGEQGTGKTTLQKMLVSTIDPGPVPIRKPPRDPESWVTAAAGSWLVALDNLSDVQPWLSDSICRAVTGDGDVRRKLYTDGEHSVFAFRRCICLNSIHLGGSRGDLAERMLPITLEVIPDEHRLTEDEIWREWDRRHPVILGALLDVAASVARVLSSVRLESKPRMADFARVLKAVDTVLGTHGLDHYLDKLAELSADSLTGSPFMLALTAMSGGFEGTSAELLTRLTPDRPPKGWPVNAGSVTQQLKRHAPALRRSRWLVTDDGGRNKQHAISWTIKRPEIACNSHSPDSPTRQNGANGESASAASADYGPSQDDHCPACSGEGDGCRWCEGTGLNPEAAS